MEQQDSNLDAFPTEYSREIVRPRDVVLPPSWDWMDGSRSKTLRCIRFLNSDGKVGVFKMIDISGDTITYYVKGIRIRNKKLRKSFSILVGS